MDQSKFNLLKEMFEEMTIKKNAELISYYYHRDFMLYTNGITMDYEEMNRIHTDLYKTDIQYSVRYEESTLVEQNNKIALRMYITIIRSNESPKELELMLIAEYQDDKILNLWELVYPDYTQDKKFSTHLKVSDQKSSGS